MISPLVARNTFNLSFLATFTILETCKMIFNLVRLLILSSVLLCMVISKIGTLPTGGKFEKYAEQYKPIRETVCAGKATKAQLTDMVKCMEQFKSSFRDMKTKVENKQSFNGI